MKRLITWVNQSLNRKFAVVIALGLVVASLLFLAVFAGLYRTQLQAERSFASRQVNSLLQAALENAMLKRDLSGLSSVVHRLGRQDGIRNVMIVNPRDEVRFSAKDDLVGRTYDRWSDPTCTPCHGTNPETDNATRLTAFMTLPDGREVLRSVNPVHNKERCTQCHGPVSANPVNGVLFVDYDAGAVRDKAQETVLLLVGAGAAVLLLTVGTLMALLRRFVLTPASGLARATDAIAQGDLDARVPVRGDDELAGLARNFNRMADSLSRSLTEIRRHEAFQQALIDAIPDGIRVIDQDFTIVAANESYRRRFGGDADCVVGARCYDHGTQYDGPCPPTLVTCPLVEVNRTGEAVKTVDRFQLDAGNSFFVETNAAPLWLPDGEGGERLLVVEAMRDLTQDIHYSHQQKLSAVGQLATNVAHEIRNPLTSTRLALQGMIRSVDAGRTDTGEVGRYLRIVDGELDKCLDVTQRLLKLSAYAGEAPRPVNIAAAVDDTVTLLGYEARETGIEVTTDVAEDVWVIAHEPDIRMVVLNLVQNAFHAMPEGGHLTVRGHVAGSTVHLVVADTGRGIEPRHVDRIFDPFFSSRADGVEGTGLGLTICKTIIDHHGGTISVSSTPGEGTRFDVTLPSAAPVDA